MAELSVLNTIKTMIGPSALYEGFNVDIMIHINSVFAYLAQMGVVPDGTKIDDENTTWSSVVPNLNMLEEIKSYIYFKVRLMFDPPANATIVNAWQEEIKQLEFRMFITCDEMVGSGAD